MENQVFNPYLPSYEYVPDGEPRIFGDRLYIFGSHDRFNGKGFCLNDYVCWTAPLSDISSWRNEGVIYRKDQDPESKGRLAMNAPDVVEGPDSRFYLYYELQTKPFISVAVANRPEGPYTFYGYVRHEDGTRYGEAKDDAFGFDPGVLVDEDERIYLYSGFAPFKGPIYTMAKLRGGEMGYGYVLELAPDMLTIVGKQHRTVPGERKAKDTAFEGHGFYEASSPRKIGNLYYLVYSSSLSHELCYATARTPLGPWNFGGTIVSIGDVGLPGVTEEKARNFLGNTHGGLCEINGQWYIFYHRQTNQQCCARQGAAEPVEIASDGSIRQVEVTSSGLNGGPLQGTGTYEARIACNLSGKDGTYAYLRNTERRKEYPYFTQSGEDREKDPDQHIANMQDGAWCGFKYFCFDGEDTVRVRTRGTGKGSLFISTEQNGGVFGTIPVNPSRTWRETTIEVDPVRGEKVALYFRFRGEGAMDFMSFTLEKTGEETLPPVQNGAGEFYYSSRPEESCDEEEMPGET
ncbi:MAG: family 43 glycosylhydrolase, partial [Lachnospiraceae bacterium]|nr:family 43 glycosylhydrolase [Lachnospiraceae bacterium]